MWPLSHSWSYYDPTTVLICGVCCIAAVLVVLLNCEVVILSVSIYFLSEHYSAPVLLVIILHNLLCGCGSEY